MGSKSYIGNNPFGSNTYEPPDVEPRISTSLRYDIWSLGGVYLDFITWLSLGHRDVLQFADMRRITHPKHKQFKTDQFYIPRGSEKRTTQRCNLET
jgi:hypothetical protein